MRTVLVILVLLAVVAVALAAYVRLAPNPAETWAVDPMAVARPASPNYVLVRPEGGDLAAPVYAEPPGALAARIDAVARAEPRTTLLAGSVAEGRMTYLTRSAVMGFPDFTSVKVLPAGDGSTFAAFARSRFGQGDFGVNRARIDRWLAALTRP